MPKPSALKEKSKPSTEISLEVLLNLKQSDALIAIARKDLEAMGKPLPRLMDVLGKLHKGKAWLCYEDIHTWKEFCEIKLPNTPHSTMYNMLLKSRFEEETPALKGIPTSQAIALADLTPDRREEAYAEATEAAGGKKPTAKIVEAVVAKLIEPPVNADTATENPGPKKAAARAERASHKSKKEEEACEKAVARLAWVLGKKLRVALEDGALTLGTKELTLWASMEDAEIKELEPLVVEQRMTPSRARAWLLHMPQSGDRFSEFHNRAISSGGVFFVVIEGCRALFTTDAAVGTALEKLANKHAK